METKIRDKKLLYHLTDLQNLEGIFLHGLRPRSMLDTYSDVADPDIIADRRRLQLENYVPFHFFCKNPFDGKVIKNHRERRFAYITIRRTLAQQRGHLVLPKHPLSHGEEIRILPYAEGVETIDWDLLEKREYADQDCKLACMAETLSPNPIAPSDFFCVYVQTIEDLHFVERILTKHTGVYNGKREVQESFFPKP